MTPTREEILAMAKAAEVVGKNNTGSGYTFDRFVAFANLAYAAGQLDMQEMAAKCCADLNDKYEHPFVAVIECAAEILKLEVK